MKSNAFLTVLFALFSTQVFAQWPEVQITDEQVVDHKVKELVITLDTAREGYKLGYDFVKRIIYDSETGYPLKEVRYESEAVQIQKQDLYEYHDDSIYIRRIDSSFGGPAFLMDVDTTIEIRLLDGGLIKTVRFYPWSRNNKLEWTKSIEYDSEGRIIRSTRVYKKLEVKHKSIRIIGGPSKSVAEYTYDDEGRVLRFVDITYDFDGSKREYRIDYRYEQSRTIETTQRGRYDGQKITIREEIFYDENGRKIKRVGYHGDGEKIETIYYTYYDNGLLRSEEKYDGNDELRLRYVTRYVME